jgi:hypothetical protein
MRERSSPTRVFAAGVHAMKAGCRPQRRPRSSKIAAFADGLAHDVRTPLTVIQEYAALMREGLVGTLNDEQQRFLDVIADRACDLNRAVDNAVDASKLAADRYRISGRRCRLREILSRIGPQLMRKAALQRVDLQFAASSDVPDIYCDQEAAGRALANIVSSALKLSREGCRISVATEVDLARKEAGVRVRAEGIGHEAMISQWRSFGETQPADGASRRCELSLAAEVISRNLGRLEIAADDGHAATLWIGLPVAEADEVLRRHLNRAMRRHRFPLRVSLFQAEIGEPRARNLSRDVGSLFNLMIGQDDLAVELDSTHWLLAITGKQSRFDALCRRIERKREATNRRRLGQPLPQVSLQSIGSWRLPNELASALAAVEKRIVRLAPASSSAE